MNPFSQSVPSQGLNPESFWGAINARRNAMQAQPFMENALSGQQADLARKLMETKEYTSPTAQDARMSGFETTAATNRAKLETLPHQTSYDITKLKEDQRALPTLTDERIAKAQQVIKGIKDAPMQEVLSSFANLYPGLRDEKDDLKKHAIWQQNLASLKQKHPELAGKLEQRFGTYNQDLMTDAAALYYGMGSGARDAQQERLKHIEGGYSLEREEMQQTGANSRAATNAAAITQRGAAKEPSPAQTEVRLNRVLNNPAMLRKYAEEIGMDEADAKEVAQAELKAIMQTKIEERYVKELGARQLEILQGKTSPDEIRSKIESRMSGKAPPALPGVAEQEQIKKILGAEYDSTKYEYKISNGKVQRKLKSQK